MIHALNCTQQPSALILKMVSVPPYEFIIALFIVPIYINLFFEKHSDAQHKTRVASTYINGRGIGGGGDGLNNKFIPY